MGCMAQIFVPKRRLSDLATAIDNTDPAGENDIGYQALYSTTENPYGRNREQNKNDIPLDKRTTTRHIEIEKASLSSIGLETLLHFRTMPARYRIRPQESTLNAVVLIPTGSPMGDSSSTSSIVTKISVDTYCWKNMEKYRSKHGARVHHVKRCELRLQLEAST